MVLLIAICEVGFWVLLAAGLVARYLFRWRRVGGVLLASTPVLDMILLVAAMIDIGRGAEATMAHGLAAAYLGFSVAFGHSMLRWADQRAQHWFAGGPAPVKPPKNGTARVRYEWREWGKCLIAWAIACATMALLTFVVGTPERTEVLWDWMTRLTAVLGIWLVAGPLWATLSATKEAPSRS